MTTETGVLPMRLAEWRLSPDQNTFAYTGDEVELSVWDTENAFTAQRQESSSNESPKKRKRSEQLLPGESWRARNVRSIELI